MVLSELLDSRKTVYLLISTTLLLALTTAGLALAWEGSTNKVEKLQNENKQMLNTIEKKNSTIKSTRATKKELEQNITKLKEENSQLESENEQLSEDLQSEKNQAMLVAGMSQWSASSYTSGEVRISLTNYGNTQAQNVDVGCGLVREGETDFYHTFSTEYGNIASNTMSDETFTFELGNKQMKEGDSMYCYALDADNGEILGKEIFSDSLQAFELYNEAVDGTAA